MADLQDFVTAPPTCIFCGTSKVTDPRAQFHKEDVFPKWFGKVLVGSTVTEMHITPNLDDFVARRSLRLVLTDAICRTCNNVWMATLEKRVKNATADAIMARRGISLTFNQQRDVARWALQKSLLMDLALRQQGDRDSLDFVTTKHLRWLYDHRISRDLPPNCSVSLFVNDVSQRETERGHRSTIFMHRTVPLSWTTEPRTDAPDGVLVTFTIAFLGFQVLVMDFDPTDPSIELPLPEPPPHVTRMLTEIHPFNHTPVRWPLRRQGLIAGQEDFKRLAQWDGALSKPPAQATARSPIDGVR